MSAGQIDVEADAARKEALRKAGQDYFEQVLAKAASGKDPFVADAASRRKTADVETTDADMETVGLVLQSSKMYILGALFFAASTLRIPLAAVRITRRAQACCSCCWWPGPCELLAPSQNAAVQPLRTPGVHCFFHLIPAAIAIWATRDLGSISLKTLHGSAVPIALSGIQVGCIFAALVADGVWMVLPWLVFHSQNMDLLRQYMLKPGKLSAVVLSVLALLACAAANSVVACFEPRVLGTLYLLVWTTAECARVAWEVAGLQDQSRPLDIGEWTGSKGEVLGALMQAQIARQSKLPQAVLEFYQSSVPAVPLLLMGLVCLEGKELVQHELSVPAVEVMLMSAAAWATAACTVGLLREVADIRLSKRIEALANISSLIAALLVHGLPELAALSFAAVGVLLGAGASLWANTRAS